MDSCCTVAPVRRGVEIRRYRLVVAIDGAGRSSCGRHFCTAKAAIARVSEVARLRVPTGKITTIELQSQATPDGLWRTVESWGADVITRIGLQTGPQQPPRQPDASPPPAHATRLEGLVELAAQPVEPDFGAEILEPEPDFDTAPEPSATPHVRRSRRPKQQRWRMVGTAGLLIAVWGALLYWMTGGELTALWVGPTATAAVAEELKWARDGNASGMPTAPAAPHTSD